MNPSALYVPRHAARDEFLDLRGVRYHLNVWGEPVPGVAPLVLVHGWMDVGASWQFFVDALAEREGRLRHIVAPDWRGFGLTEASPHGTYWFPDYLADLDALLDHLSPDQPVDLAGHSLGGNVVMIYAGVRPQRIRRLVNAEGFGMPKTTGEEAPRRLAKWLNELKTPERFKPYENLAGVAKRLMKGNPLLPLDKANWLAAHWARQGEDGLFHLLGDPAHKRVNPVLSRKDESLATWARITAPLLWVEGDLTDTSIWWGDRYPRSEFEERLQVVKHVERLRLSPAGHMLHHDQPEALAARVAEFLQPAG